MGTRAVSGPEQGAHLQGRGGEMPAGMRPEGVPGCLTSASAAPHEAHRFSTTGVFSQGLCVQLHKG